MTKPGVTTHPAPTRAELEQAFPATVTPPSFAPSRMERAIRALGELPPFSPILNRLMASLAEESVSMAELADLIEKDAALAGNVLALVNSSIYGRRSTVSSVRHALSLLGVRKIRNVALGMSVTGMWSQSRYPQGWSTAAFNMHSAATAVLADMLAVQAAVEYPEGAFAAGLLHDLGRLLIATALPVEFLDLERRRNAPCANERECEQAVLGFTHEELSERALRTWRLPEPIIHAVGLHHAAAPEITEGVEIPLAVVLMAADRYVTSIGLGESGAAPAAQPDEAALDSLRLTRPRVEKILTAFETEFAAVAPLFR